MAAGSIDYSPTIKGDALTTTPDAFVICTPPIPAGCTGNLRLALVQKRSNTDSPGSCVREYLVHRSAAGVIHYVSAATLDRSNLKDGATVAVAFDGNDLKVTVTPGAANTYRWGCVCSWEPLHQNDYDYAAA